MGWGEARLVVRLLVSLRCGLEALDRGTHDPGADLPTALAGEPGVEHWRRPGLRNLEHIDTDRRATVAEEWDAIVGVFANGDVIHRQVELNHCLGRAALIVLQREGSGLGESTQADGLGDQAFTADPFDVVFDEAFEQPRCAAGNGP